MREVTIPDIGDAEEVEVIEICVSPGDAVAENDALIVIESDKASMEVPSPFAGTVSEVLVALSDHVNAGDAIVRLEGAERDAPDVDAEQAEASAVSEAVVHAAPETTPPDARAEQSETTSPQAASATPQAPAAAQQPSSPGKVYAGPAVRRLAREMGVALAQVQGTGVAGRIVKDDVKAFVKRALTAQPMQGPALQPMEAIDFSRFGDVEIVPLTRIRQRGAANLHRSWQHVVHVTAHDDADVTDLDAFRASLREEAPDAKLTPLPFIVKASIHAMRRHPRFNASLDPSATALVCKRYFHVGIAVDTEDGLVVPVVRDADQLGLFDLAEKIAALSQAAREGKLRPDDLQGGSFTISSLGAIGGTGFTPIVNAPEVAILGVARLAVRPVWDGAEFRPRKLLPLSLSYDHRAINGAEAGRFMAELVATLEDIRRLAL